MVDISASRTERREKFCSRSPIFFLYSFWFLLWNMILCVFYYYLELDANLERKYRIFYESLTHEKTMCDKFATKHRNHKLNFYMDIQIKTILFAHSSNYRTMRWQNNGSSTDVHVLREPRMEGEISLKSFFFY